MTPSYRITVAGSDDITARIRARLLSLTVTDNNGEESDTLRLTLENADGKLITPDPGAALRVHLGFAGHPLRDMGVYTVSEVRDSGPPSQIEITAQSAPFTTGTTDATPLQSRHTVSWEAGMTIADLVKTIAAASKLTPCITPTAAAIVLPHLDQTDESDLNFLTRIAEGNNSWVKPAFGKLIFAHENDVRLSTAPASSTAPVTVDKSQVTTYEHTRKARQYFASAIATWHDTAAARQVEERIGPDAEPVFRIPGDYPDARSARDAANAKLLDLRREGTTLDITLPPPPDLPYCAEGSITARNFGGKIDGLWKLTSVEWTLSESGLSCSLKSEVAAPETESPDTLQNE